MSETGVNSMQVPSDILLRLVDATEEIRNLLRQKAGQENGTVQQINGASHQGEDSLVPDAIAHQPLITKMADVEPLITDMADEETDNRDDWLNDETIARYRNRCARHKRECEKMQVELECYIAHLGIFGGDKDVITYAESLRKELLGPIQCLERAFDVNSDGRRNAMDNVKLSFGSHARRVLNLAWSLFKEDALYPDKIRQWEGIISNGGHKIYELVREGKFVECLKFIHDKLFTDLESAMSGVVEALTAFEEKHASELLATLKIELFERQCNDYMSRVFPPTRAIRGQDNWPEPDEIQKLGQRLAEHKSFSNEMRVELDHLVSHYTIIGGDNAVIKATTSLKGAMLSYVQYLENAVHDNPLAFRNEMCDVVKRLLIAVIRFQSSLYHQKHAFYFRKVKQWVTCTWIGTLRILRLLHQGKVSQCLTYICDTFLYEFERAMLGVAHGDQAKLGENSTNAISEELKTYGRESLPKFLVDQMDRDTTRYINLTTIATFFSSVTATTLQFTYAPLQTEASDSLRGVVNLFWFLSLVFSVSSGVSSLLGLTWRKSSIYDSRVPPKLIRMWLDKAPMLFLIIAAVTFVIGLNMFAYLSLQPSFVSLSTSILTGLHGMCLLVVTFWFIYQLKYDSVWGGWIRIAMKPITSIAHWIIVEATEWIGTGVKWIGIGMKWIRIGLPFAIYAVWFFGTCIRDTGLHLLRSIIWLFGFDNLVARLNNCIYWSFDWPEPCLLSKCIRRIAFLIKKGWLTTKNAIFYCGLSVRKQICVLSRADPTEDNLELGGRGTQDDTGVPEEALPESPAEKAKNEFRRSLQKIFSEAHWVDEILIIVEEWENGYCEEYVERRIRRSLWGYPDLVKEFHDRVCPALVEERRKRLPKWITSDRDNDSVLKPAIVIQVEDDTASIPPQTSQTVRFDGGPGPSGVIKTDVQQDSPTQQDRPLPPDQHSLFTASTVAEALRPTSEDPDLPLDIPRIEEGPILSNEILKVASTLEYEDERSRATQRKGKARE